MNTSRLLLVNGNSRVALTERMTQRARAILGAAAEIEPMTIGTAPPHISIRAEATAAAPAILQAVAARVADSDAPRVDAVMLACFGEPGLWALRETLAVPVTGMAEASVAVAIQLGRRISILTSGRHWPAQIEDLLQLYGQSARVVRVTAVPDAALSDDRGTWRPALNTAIAADHAKGGADVTVLGGGPLAGRAPALTAPDGLRLVDAFDAALVQTLALARLDHSSRTDFE